MRSRRTSNSLGLRWTRWPRTSTILRSRSTLNCGLSNFGSGSSELDRRKAARMRARSSPHWEGFYNVIVGSGIENLNLVLFGISDGDHDNGPSERQSNLAACLKPAHAGHVHIQQDQIRVLAHNHFDGFLPVLRQYDVIAVTRKRGLQHAANAARRRPQGWLCRPSLYPACRSDKELLALNMAFAIVRKAQKKA